MRFIKSMDLLRAHFCTALGRPAGTGSYVNESARRVQDFTNFND